MTVYVDSLMPCPRSRRWPYGSSCHLFGTDWKELHAFAARLGLKHSWFQSKPGRLSHDDLTEGMRKRAVALGALAVGPDRWSIVKAYAFCGDAYAQDIVGRAYSRLDTDIIATNITNRALLAMGEAGQLELPDAVGGPGCKVNVQGRTGNQ